MLTHLLTAVLGGPVTEAAPPLMACDLSALAKRVQEVAHQRLGRGLTIRQVDAGSCNGCELEIHALNNVYYDLERFGLRFTASPRHADVLLVTGPVTTQMRTALERTWAATPAPKRVVAVGDCGCDGGVFCGGAGVVGGVGAVIPVDLTIPGCPPSPTRLLQGLLAVLEFTNGRVVAEHRPA
ncbi:MAG: hydrogenase [Rhodospirillaceae bacterium]